MSPLCRAQRVSTTGSGRRYDRILHRLTYPCRPCLDKRRSTCLMTPCAGGSLPLRQGARCALLDDIEEFYFEDQRRARLDGRR